jgi:hypothetical protein
MPIDRDTDPDKPVAETDPDKRLTETDPDYAEARPLVPEAVEQVDLRLATDRLEVDAGGRVTLVVTISNISRRTRHFRLEVEGIPASWLPDFPLPIRLFREGLEGSTGQAMLTISPPREPQSTAKDYSVWISAVSEDDQVRSERQPLVLTVNPYWEFSTELWPEVYRSGQEAELLVHNQGNHTRTFMIRGSDPGDEVRFAPSERLLELEPGKEERVGFKVSARRLNLFGQPQDYRFTLQTTALEGEPQEENQYGVVRSWRLIPPWALLFLLALLCVPTTAFVFLLSQRQQPELAAVISGQPTALAQFPVSTPTPTPIAVLEVTPSKRLIEEGDCVILQVVGENLERIVVTGNDQGADDVFEPGPVIVAQVPRCPKETTTYIISGYRTTEDSIPEITKAEIIQVQRLISQTITFSELPDGQTICPGCKLEGDEYSSQGIIFSVAADKLPGQCTSREPVVGIFTADWNTLFLMTIFTKQESGTQNGQTVCEPAPTPAPSTGNGTPGAIDLPSCRMPTATPTKSPLQQCTFAPLKISFMRATREATFTFAFNPPSNTSVEFTGLPAGTTFEDPGEATNIRTIRVGPGLRIKDVIFGLDGRPVAITKIEYKYLQQ